MIRQAYIQGLALVDDAPLLLYLRSHAWHVQACEYWPQTGLLILGIKSPTIPIDAIVQTMSLLTPFLGNNSHLQANHSFLIVTSGNQPEMYGVDPLSIEALEWPSRDSRTVLALETWLMSHFGDVNRLDTLRLKQLKHLVAQQVWRQWRWRDHFGQVQHHYGQLTAVYRRQSQHFVRIDNELEVPVEQLVGLE
ncbi:MAG: hypothetical protein ACRCT7_08240 [Shewanella sp.]